MRIITEIITASMIIPPIIYGSWFVGPLQYVSIPFGPGRLTQFLICPGDIRSAKTVWEVVIKPKMNNVKILNIFFIILI